MTSIKKQLEELQDKLFELRMDLKYLLSDCVRDPEADSMDRVTDIPEEYLMLTWLDEVDYALDKLIKKLADNDPQLDKDIINGDK